jgi:hypothetical protein
MLGWLGRLSLLKALLVVAVGALLGVIFTLAASQEPGGLLGVFVILGTVAAVFGIQRRQVYLLFPVPALAFFASAIVTGKVHDANLGSSTAGLGAGFTQWIAGIFFPAVVATVVVIVVGGGRLLFGSQLITGRAPAPGGLTAAPRNARPAPGARRSGPDDSWSAEDPFAGGNQNRTGPTPRSGPGPRPGTGPWPGTAPRAGGAPRSGGNPRSDGVSRPDGPGRPGPGSNRTSRPGRDPRTDRDPWGDPRLPGERSQPPAGPRRPAGPPSQPQPRDPGTGSQPRPTWNPGARPQRRPQPPDDWNHR